MILTWIFLFLWFCVKLGLPTPLPPGGVTRTNYGVDFNFLYSINNMHGSWKHVWTMDLNLIDRKTSYDLNLNCQSIDPMCDPAHHFLTVMRRASLETTKWMSDQFTWARDPSILSTLNRQMKNTGRAKRALLPFIGDIEKFFFGTATESDISAIKKTLDDMTSLQSKSVHEISNLGENLASLTKITNDQIRNSKEGFKLIKNTFENMTTQINTRFQTIMNDLSKESENTRLNSLAVGHTWASLESILPLMLESVKLLIADTQLLDAIQTLLQGYLPISIVPPEELIDGLKVALQGVQTQFPSAQLTYSDKYLGFYYTHKIVTPYFDGKSISLIVDIPIDLGQDLLYVYAIRTFPVSILPFNPYSRTVDPLSKYGVAQSELILKDDHFIISSDGLTWSSSRSVDMISCTGETIRSCKHQFPMYKFQNTHCLERIWNNQQFSDILEVCPYRLSHPGSTKTIDKHIQVIPLTSGRWYIESPLNEQWTITCPSRPPEKRSSCTSCVIQVDCGCGVESKYFRIPTRVSSCTSVFSPLHKNFTINPFNYQPKSQPWIVNLTGDDILPSPPRSKPDIRLPDGGSWDDVLESMDSKQFDLNKLYKKQENESRVFRTEAEALLLKIKTQDKMLEALSGWPDWILGLMLVLTFGNTAVLALLCCWFFTHARARPIIDELGILEQKENLLIDLEVMEFILVCCCFILLIMITWPTFSSWIHNSRMYRRFKGINLTLKANGYRSIRGHQKIILQGILMFGDSETAAQRMIPCRCLLATVPIGTHLGRSPRPLKPIVAIQEDRYYMEFPDPIVTISPTEKENSCTGLYFSYDYVHRKCHVPMASKWASISECRLWIE